MHNCHKAHSGPADVLSALSRTPLQPTSTDRETERETERESKQKERRDTGRGYKANGGKTDCGVGEGHCECEKKDGLQMVTSCIHVDLGESSSASLPFFDAGLHSKLFDSQGERARERERGEASFSAYPFWLFGKQKQNILGILREKKGKREGTKRTTKTGRAFLGRKVHFLPSCKQIIA